VDRGNKQELERPRLSELKKSTDVADSATRSILELGEF
jgi:hypothetical protein